MFDISEYLFTSSVNFVCFQLRLRLYALSICLLEAMLAERNMYRNLGYPSIERLWHIAVAFLIFCALFALGYSSVFVPFAAVESLQFCFCTYETAFHVELQSSFFAGASSSQWLTDSGASKHMCFDKDSFDQNTFVSGSNTAWFLWCCDGVGKPSYRLFPFPWVANRNRELIRFKIYRMIHVRKYTNHKKTNVQI